MRKRFLVLSMVAFCIAPVIADAPEGSPKTMSRSGIPYKPDDAQAGPKEIVDAIRARRPGGKLLNLDRILLHSPNFAKGWNGLFRAIRGHLAVPAKLRETAIMAVGALNQAEYEWVQHEKEYLGAGAPRHSSPR